MSVPRRAVRALAAGGALALLLVLPALAQELDASAPAETAPAKPAVKPKPRPKPKPRLDKAAPEKAEAAREPDGRTRPELRTRGDGPDPAAAEATPSQGAFAAPVVACESGQAVLYDGPKAFAFWVTRAGVVTIDNPLRPLTPDVTRVLQLVIGDRLATAYGRDLSQLRRGASPAVLEKLLGGPIRWDARLGSLPDTLDIVTDSGEPLAQMRFKECGTAPAAKAAPAPVARKERENTRKDKERPARRGASPEQAGAPAAPSFASPGPAAAPRRLNLPQGALPE